MTAVVVVTGGAALSEAMAGEVPGGAYVIAADSGLDHALALGLDVDMVIGDLDSARHLPPPEAELRLFPADKAATDLELALSAALERDPLDILVLGGHGGRFDHHLGNALVLCSPAWADVDVVWVTDQARTHVVRRAVTVHGSPGDPVSLLAVDGPVTGIVTTGLRWPLDGDTLAFGSSRGVSNQLSAPIARVRVGTGTLLVVQPAAAG